MTDYRINAGTTDYQVIKNCLECGGELKQGPRDQKSCGFHMRVFLDDSVMGVEFG